MIGIIDYGAGNLGSVKKAFAYLSVPYRVITSAEGLPGVTGVVLPGVGSFGPAVEKLKTSGFYTALQDYIAANRPFLGICLGMQLLMETSAESPGIIGLAAVKGMCRRFQVGKVPHMGWNRVYPRKESPLFNGIPGGSFFYFVHSYHVQGREDELERWTTAVTPYSVLYPSVFEAGNVCAVQFHPEKSGEMGLRFLQNWIASKSFSGVQPRGAGCLSGFDFSTPSTIDDHTSNSVGFNPFQLLRAKTVLSSPPGQGTTIRIIPCLDIDNGRVVKGVQFENIRDAGDPVELAALYDGQGADEIAFLDIGATYKSREILLDVVEKVSGQVFVPLTVGGGLGTIEDMRKVLHAGADKVSICSAALRNPALLSEGARLFGNQCMVLSIDAKRVGNSWHAFMNGGRIDSGIHAFQWAQQAEQLGAGEILLNSIDQDGTQAGYDLELTREISAAVTIPVIASGGAGTLDHMVDVVNNGMADAVLLASLLHDRKLSLPDIKSYLKQKGVSIR